LQAAKAADRIKKAAAIFIFIYPPVSAEKTWILKLKALVRAQL